MTDEMKLRKRARMSPLYLWIQRSCNHFLLKLIFMSHEYGNFCEWFLHMLNNNKVGSAIFFLA